MYDIYFWTTPNGYKTLLFAEEAELLYTIKPMNIGKGEQFDPAFLSISPNNRIPALVDHAPATADGPLAIFESGAILLYLAEKTGRFILSDLRGRNEVLQWLFWQMGGLGPMAGQNHHFTHYAPERFPYPTDRYQNETNRLYGVLDHRLADRPFMAGDAYTIADMASYPWVQPAGASEAEHRRFPASQALESRDRRAARDRSRLCERKGGEHRPGRHQRLGERPLRTESDALTH